MNSVFDVARSNAAAENAEQAENVRVRRRRWAVGSGFEESNGAFTMQTKDKGRTFIMAALKTWNDPQTICNGVYDMANISDPSFKPKNDIVEVGQLAKLLEAAALKLEGREVNQLNVGELESILDEIGLKDEIKEREAALAKALAEAKVKANKEPGPISFAMTDQESDLMKEAIEQGNGAAQGDILASAHRALESNNE